MKALTSKKVNVYTKEKRQEVEKGQIKYNMTGKRSQILQ